MATGEIVDTEVIRIRRKTFLRKYNKANGWYTDWAELGRPVSLSELPYSLDIRAAMAYAKAKGMAVSALSDAEKQRFLVANGAFLSAAAAN